MTDKALTQGAHHIGLTVPDLEKTRSFFVETLGFLQVGQLEAYPAVFLSDGATVITLWQATHPTTAVPFDRKNVIGLHHFALKVDGLGALEALHDKLAATADVEVEFSPEFLGDGPAHHLMCSIPGGIRMEFIAPVG
jgi:catechol 2,3-dioxygenase-like lactoylglutathione lyase family enzyme